MTITHGAFLCDTVTALPFGGTEILLISCVYIFLTVCFCVTFLDVAIKQLCPSKFLDPAVAARVAEVQAKFPKLNQPKPTPKPPAPHHESQGLLNSAEDVDGTHALVVTKVTASDMPDYDGCTSQAAYIAGQSVDEDLIPILANGKVFPTVSSYCSCTVRGYTMLSTTLMVAGVSLGFLWVHNVTVNPSAGDLPGKLSLLGYVLVFLTGIVMTGPNNNAVNRDANICLWSNFPLTICGKSNPILKLHDIGITGFCLLPMLMHLYTLLAAGSSAPNFQTGLVLIGCQLLGAVIFGVPLALKKYIGDVTADKISILGEVVAVFASFLAFIQYEFFATAACANASATFNSLLVGALFTPFGFIAKHYWCAPQSFTASPSLLLTKGSKAVAATGPAPVMVFDNNGVPLPIVQ